MSSKLSPALKSLISASHALGGPLPAPKNLTSLLSSIRSRSKQHLEPTSGPSDPFVVLAAAALATVNSPDSLCGLYKYAASGQGDERAQARTAALVRETGLKCISFNGIPRTINALVALRASLPPSISAQLSSEPTREPSPAQLGPVADRGRQLWDNIYTPFHDKLLAKLGDAHPDLPVHILGSHYGPLLADPPSPSDRTRVSSTGLVGRTLTSLVAITCLRAQTGVEPQLVSHVHGLKKALKEPDDLPGREWLCSDEGVEWILSSVDEISHQVGQGRTFGGGMPKAKL